MSWNKFFFTKKHMHIDAVTRKWPWWAQIRVVLYLESDSTNQPFRKSFLRFLKGSLLKISLAFAGFWLWDPSTAQHGQATGCGTAGVTSCLATSCPLTPNLMCFWYSGTRAVIFPSRLPISANRASRQENVMRAKHVINDLLFRSLKNRFKNNFYELLQMHSSLHT